MGEWVARTRSPPAPPDFPVALEIRWAPRDLVLPNGKVGRSGPAVKDIPVRPSGPFFLCSEDLGGCSGTALRERRAAQAHWTRTLKKNTSIELGTEVGGSVCCGSGSPPSWLVETENTRTHIYEGRRKHKVGEGPRTGRRGRRLCYSGSQQERAPLMYDHTNRAHWQRNHWQRLVGEGVGRQSPGTQGQQQISVTTSVPRRAQGRDGWKERVEQAAPRGTMAFSEGTPSSSGHRTAMDPGDNSSGLILFLPSDPNQGFPLARPNQKPEGKEVHWCCS